MPDRLPLLPPATDATFEELRDFGEKRLNQIFGGHFIYDPSTHGRMKDAYVLGLREENFSGDFQTPACSMASFLLGLIDAPNFKAQQALVTLPLN